jgi:hypothetical protein
MNDKPALPEPPEPPVSWGLAVGRIAFDVSKAGLSEAALFLTIFDSETFDEAAGFFAVT